MRVPNPITTWEFVGMLKKCTPPAGWPRKLAVANSGGPDSTCLLFLLSAVLSRNQGSPPSKIEGCFESLVSLTVDHQFQACSSDMSNHAARTAAALGVEHLTSKIPWSIPPYVPKPDPGTPIESIARDARYSVLFESMNRVGAETIAFGHHTDDQVETFLMRIIKGTSVLGLGGMKPVRRFGMGTVGPGRMGWFGHTGMNRWIVRPLLGVSKDRILTTCEANKLDYVTDSTNFQPELTLRNALRYVLSHKPVNTDKDFAFSSDLEKLEDHAKSLGITVDLSRGPALLRTTVKQYSEVLESIETQGHEHLSLCVLPSPPSSVLLSIDHMTQIRNPTICLAMVTSILRHVSPHPWGSYTAEASRNSSRLRLIISKLWAVDPKEFKPFSAGAGVLWTPVIVNSKGQIKMKSATLPQGSHGWLATRAPPYRNAITRDGVNLDITPNLEHKFREPTAPRIIQVLYDCRFLVTIDLAAIPDHVKRKFARDDSMGAAPYRFMIVPDSRYHLPRIVLRSLEKRSPDVVLATISYKTVAATRNILVTGGFSSAPWASWEFVRKLSAY